MGDVRLTIRLSEDLFERIKGAELNVSEGIRDVLTRAYAAEKVDTDMGVVFHEKVRHDFRFPIGDVICYDTSPQTQLWWCPDEQMSNVTKRVEPWTKNGFRFCIGKKGSGSWYSPEVIEEEAQERRKNGQFCVSCKGVGAKVGDRLVWLEITDETKALEFMHNNTDIPCAVRCDIHKYTDSVEYQEAFERANELFIYYWANGKGKRLSSDKMSKYDVEEMLDL